VSAQIFCARGQRDPRIVTSQSAPSGCGTFRLAGVGGEEVTLNAETLELINSELTARLARQAGSSDKIDTKAVVLVGYVIAAVSFLATQHPEPILAGLAYAAYAVAAALGVSAYAVRSYGDVPDPRGLFNGYVVLPRSRALAALAAVRVKAFEGNASTLRRKAGLWWFSVVTLLAGVILMVISIVVHNDGHGGAARPQPRAVAAVASYIAT
jgi:hypothetical protein